MIDITFSTTTQLAAAVRTAQVSTIDALEAFWRSLAETYGHDSHRMIWTTVAQGKSLEDALQMVTGKSFVESETDFCKWLRMANPVPPTLVPTPELGFPPTPDPNQ